MTTRDKELFNLLLATLAGVVDLFERSTGLTLGVLINVPGGDTRLVWDGEKFNGFSDEQKT